MNREIKFRGKPLSDVYDHYAGKYLFKKSDFVYGNLIVDGNRRFIVGEVVDIDSEYIALEWWVEVDLETVGQYTGFMDRNGVKVFEGDITHHHRHGDTACWVWHDRHICYVGKPLDGEISDRYYYQDLDVPDLEVLGNKWDNPELKKEVLGDD